MQCQVLGMAASTHWFQFDPQYNVRCSAWQLQHTGCSLTHNAMSGARHGSFNTPVPVRPTMQCQELGMAASTHWFQLDPQCNGRCSAWQLQHTGCSLTHNTMSGARHGSFNTPVAVRPTMQCQVLGISLRVNYFETIGGV